VRCSPEMASRIADARPQALVAVTGTISAAAAISIGSSPAYRCTLTDGTGELGLLFLGRAAVACLTEGTQCTVTGRAGLDGGRLVVWNPRYWLQPREDARATCQYAELAADRAAGTSRTRLPALR